VRSVEKRWGWIKRGVPIVCEIGARDVSAGAVTLMRRDRTRNGDKLHSVGLKRGEFVATAAQALGEIQQSLRDEAGARLRQNIRTDLTSLAELEAYFKDSDESESFRGWAEVPWARPEGEALTAVEARLKALKLTIRVAPLNQADVAGKRCLFSDVPATESVLVGRAY
jgi:prolyl-tRNA synthetase